MRDKFVYFFNFIKNPLIVNEKKEFFYLIDGALMIFLPSVIIYNFLLIYTSYSSELLVFPELDFEFFIYIIMIAPVLEELIFRLNLKKTKKNLLISSFSCLIYIVIRYFYFNEFGKVDFVLSILLVYFLFNFYVGQKKLLKFNFYFLNFIFAFLHIFNYEFDLFLILIYFFGILNYLILSFVFSYYRIYYSFKTNVMMHIFYNSLSILPIVLKTYSNSI